jgi:hypothetical protein
MTDGAVNPGEARPAVPVTDDQPALEPEPSAGMAAALAADEEGTPAFEQAEVALSLDASTVSEGFTLAEPPDDEVLEDVPQPRTLSLQLSAPLRVVAASDYLRYGSGGVRRYGPQEDLETPPVDASSLVVAMIWETAEGEVPLYLPDIPLRQTESDEHHTLWVGRASIYGLQVAWVWDFYRLLSHLFLRVAFSSPPTPEQDSLLAAVRALCQGDRIRLAVALDSGAFEQAHPVTAAVLAARDSSLADQ